MTEILALQQLEVEAESAQEAAYPCLSIFASHYYETL
ncbi:class III lanthipeptide [Kitasatospora sp. NPDC001540]